MAPKSVHKTPRAPLTQTLGVFGQGGLVRVDPAGHPDAVPYDQVPALIGLGGSAGGGSGPGYWTPITNGDPVVPEILFDAGGDCVVGFVPTPSA